MRDEKDMAKLRSPTAVLSGFLLLVALVYNQVSFQDYAMPLTVAVILALAVMALGVLEILRKRHRVITIVMGALMLAAAAILYDSTIRLLS